MRRTLWRPQWQNFKETLQSDTVNYSWRDISCNEVERTTQACFSSFPHAFPTPPFPIPQHPYPPLHSPRPPRICRALPMSALQRHSFPETRTSRSGAILPSACHAASHQSDALRRMIPHHRVTELAHYVGLVVTTPGHDNWMPGEAMYTHILPCLFFILLGCKINPASNPGHMWSTMTCLTSPALTVGSSLCIIMWTCRALD